MKIHKNKVVSFHYKMTHRTVDGELLESTFGRSPVVFIWGNGEIFLEVERNIEGLEAGDKFSFAVKAKDAYGEHDKNNVHEVPRNIFGTNVNNPDIMRVGNFIPMSDKTGNFVEGLIVEVSDSTIKLDFNHPMAGEDLWFSGIIEHVRDATADEMSRMNTKER